MVETFRMVIMRVDNDHNEVVLWSAGDEDVAETEMTWKYHKNIPTITDRVGDTYMVTISKVLKKEGKKNV